MPTEAQVLDLIARVAQVDEVRKDLDLALYDLHLLDSLKTVELIVAFSEQFGIEVSPAEFEREQWGTPRKIIAFVRDKAGM